MTMQQAIRQADALRPNAVAMAQKRQWLRELDARLRREVVALHADPPADTGADQSDAEDPTLLAGAGDGQLYLYYLAAQCDLAEGELTRYNNDMLLYNAALTAYCAAYKAQHKPLLRGQFVL